MLTCSSAYVTAGTTFSFAFPPVFMDETNGICIIYISALNATTVTITAGSEFDVTVIEMEARSTTNQTFDCAMRTERFLENGKTIHIEATFPISIYALNVGYEGFDPAGKSKQYGRIVWVSYTTITLTLVKYLLHDNVV